jgi:propanol-preferring alcohol dehydrogenase
MKAVLLKAPKTPLVLETVPDPVPGPGEVVARVLACGAGLTLHHARAGRMILKKYPQILGHEITAEIVALGAGVTELKVGDPVTAYFYLTCGHCHWCRINRETLCDNLGGYIGRETDGGYAEFIKLPARNCIKLPPGLDWRAGRKGCLRRVDTGQVIRARHAGDTVAVFGAGAAWRACGWRWAHRAR